MREEFIEKLETLKDREFIFIDESGIDLNIQKEYGYELKGKRLFDEKYGNKANEKRITIISGSLNNKFIAPFRFEGYTNTESFNIWIKENLLPELKPNQVIVMDNASFHKSQKTRELIESKGCNLLYLPPYSPDFNPIEKMWGSMKKFYRNHKYKYNDVYELIDDLLCNRKISTI